MERTTPTTPSRDGIKPLRDALARTGIDEAAMDDAQVVALLRAVAVRARGAPGGLAGRLGR